MTELNDHYIRVDEDMKFAALSQLRAIQSKLIETSFLNVIAIMRPSNKLKTAILAFQDELDDLTDKVGEFIRKEKEDVDYEPEEVLTKKEIKASEEDKESDKEEPVIDDKIKTSKDVVDSSKTKEEI